MTKQLILSLYRVFSNSWSCLILTTQIKLFFPLLFFPSSSSSSFLSSSLLPLLEYKPLVHHEVKVLLPQRWKQAVAHWSHLLFIELMDAPFYREKRVRLTYSGSIPDASDKKKIYLQCRRPRFNPWVRKVSWRRKWLPTPVFLPGEFHGEKSLVGYSPWGCKESDTTERLTFSHIIFKKHVIFICLLTMYISFL